MNPLAFQGISMSKRRVFDSHQRKIFRSNTNDDQTLYHFLRLLSYLFPGYNQLES
jgi:hypothetical protein